MNVPYAVLVLLAFATLVHLKLEYDREHDPDTESAGTGPSEVRH